MNDLTSTVLAAAGVAIVATLAVLEDLTLFQDVFIGAGVGAVVGKLIVSWRERDGDEMPDLRRRQLEVRWIVVGAMLGLVLNVGARLL